MKIVRAVRSERFAVYVEITNLVRIFSCQTREYTRTPVAARRWVPFAVQPNEKIACTITECDNASVGKGRCTRSRPLPREKPGNFEREPDQAKCEQLRKIRKWKNIKEKYLFSQLRTRLSFSRVINPDNGSSFFIVSACLRRPLRKLPFRLVPVCTFVFRRYFPKFLR